MSSLDGLMGAVERVASAAAGPSLAALGVDAVDIASFERDIKLAGDDFLTQCFDREELEHCDGNVEKLAARFALKEAALKALGTGIRGIGLRDVVVETAASGVPTIRLSEDALAVATARRLGPLLCSATHEAGLAVAVVAASLSTNLEDQ